MANPILPAEPWRSICEHTVNEFLEAQDEPTGNSEAAAGETARRIYRWSKDACHTPPSVQGFHPGYIEDARDRHATRLRLEQLIMDSATALDRTCGIGSIIVHLQGEGGPYFSPFPTSPQPVDDNLIIYASDTISRNPEFSSALDEMRRFICMFILVLFKNDWRLRAARNARNSSNDPFAEPSQAIPFIPMVWARPTLPGPFSPFAQVTPFSPTTNSPNGPAANQAHASPTHAPGVYSQLTSTGVHEINASNQPTPPLASQMERLSISAQHSQASRPSSQARHGPASFTPFRSSVGSNMLPRNVRDVLQDLDSDQRDVQFVEHIYEEIPQSRWIEGLMILGYNYGTALALALFMRLGA